MGHRRWRGWDGIWMENFPFYNPVDQWAHCTFIRIRTWIQSYFVWINFYLNIFRIEIILDSILNFIFPITSFLFFLNSTHNCVLRHNFAMPDSESTTLIILFAKSWRKHNEFWSTEGLEFPKFSKNKRRFSNIFFRFFCEKQSKIALPKLRYKFQSPLKKFYSCLYNFWELYLLIIKIN